jgi:hypothetical protein
MTAAAGDALSHPLGDDDRKPFLHGVRRRGFSATCQASASHPHWPSFRLQTHGRHEFLGGNGAAAASHSIIALLADN